MPGVQRPPSTWGVRTRARLTPAWVQRWRVERVRALLLTAGDASKEVLVDEVYHHWVVYLPAAGAALGALLLTAIAASAFPGDGFVLLLVLAAGVLGYAAWLWLVQFMDIFVITEVRVLRVSGILNSNQASTPLSRILDITLQQPLLGRVLDYGHFVFESAAQDQGLRDIRFVEHPGLRDKEIQGLQVDLLKKRSPRGRSSGGES